MCSCRRGATSGDAPRAQHSGRILTTHRLIDSSTHRHDHSVWERQPSRSHSPSPQCQSRSRSPSPRLTATALELLAQPSAQSPTAPVLEPQLQPWSLGALEALARGPLSDPGPNLRQSIVGNLPWATEGPILSRKPLKTEGFMGFLTSHQPLTLQKTLKCLEKHGFSGKYWNQKIF